MAMITIYPTPQSLQDKVDEYFNWCFVPVYSKTYDRTFLKAVNPPTMSGLARYLGFSSRGQLLSYVSDKDEAYDDILAQAKLRVEEYLETQLVTTKGNAAGVIFALKNNAKWDDQVKKPLEDDDKPLVIGWSTSAPDLIEATAVIPEKMTPTPVGGELEESTYAEIVPEGE